MPVIHQLADHAEIHEWLHNYRRMYLERDVKDLASLRDLEPFITAQKAIASYTGKMVNFSDLARLASISPSTAKRFLRYLELSFQVLELPPYHRNSQKRLAKMPKVHFIDPGVYRNIINRHGSPTGHELETFVISEIYKQIKNAGIRADFYHLRTYDGREVDLLLELEDEFIAFEIKSKTKIARRDARHLRGLESLLDKPIARSFVLSMDRDV
jgi:hypothetical protein